jgi:hypothetical protein
MKINENSDGSILARIPIRSTLLYVNQLLQEEAKVNIHVPVGTSYLKLALGFARNSNGYRDEKWIPDFLLSGTRVIHNDENESTKP